MQRVFLTIAIIFVFLSVLGFGGDCFWLLELLSSLRVQLIYTGVVLFIFVALSRNVTRMTLALVIVGLLVNGYVLLSASGKLVLGDADHDSYSAVSLNLGRHNDNYDLVKQYLKSADADFLFLYEMTPGWGENLKNLLRTYRDGRAVFRTDNFGIGLFSKFPITEVEEQKKGALEIPLVLAKIAVDSTPVLFVAAHPFPPLGPTGLKERNRYIDAIDIDNYPAENTVLCGDLNMTPWSSRFFALLKKTDLKRIENSWSMPTWPAGLPQILQIPIDHCLVSKQISVYKYQRGPYVGSDHNPIELQFSFRKGARQPVLPLPRHSASNEAARAANTSLNSTVKR